MLLYVLASCSQNIIIIGADLRLLFLWLLYDATQIHDSADADSVCSIRFDSSREIRCRSVPHP